MATRLARDGPRTAGEVEDDEDAFEQIAHGYEPLVLPTAWRNMSYSEWGARFGGTADMDATEKRRDRARVMRNRFRHGTPIARAVPLPHPAQAHLPIPTTYLVPSQSHPAQTPGFRRYVVDTHAITCTCPDFVENGNVCKHLYVAMEEVQRSETVLVVVHLHTLTLCLFSFSL